MLRHSGISNFNVLEFQFQYLYMYTSGWLVVVKAMPTPPTTMFILSMVFCLWKPVIFVMEMQHEKICLNSQRTKMAMVRINTQRLLSILCVSHSAFPQSGELLQNSFAFVDGISFWAISCGQSGGFRQSQPTYRTFHISCTYFHFIYCTFNIFIYFFFYFIFISVIGFVRW